MDTTSDCELSVEELARLIDNLNKTIDLDARLASLRVLPVIARALGPVRTRTELIPYLINTIDDEDEAMVVLAEQIKELVLLAGDATESACLLPILEELASHEEAVVRQQAALGLNVVAKQLPAKELFDLYIPLVDRLTSGHWSNLRATACALYPTLYQVGTGEEFRTSVISAFEQLCQDVAPAVRRAAADNLQSMLSCCSAQVASERLKPLFLQFMDDDQDSVRLLAVGCLPELAKSLPPTHHGTIITPNCERACKDDSWRVRYMLADVITNLQAVLDSELSDRFLLPVFVQLLHDSEAEVRACAAGKVYDFSLQLGSARRVENLQAHILPQVCLLVEDPSSLVRASIASVVMCLSAIVGKTITIQHLLPLFLKLLKGEDSQVTLNVISKLEQVNRIIGLDLLINELLPAIHDLADNQEWRTRLAIIDFIPEISRQLGSDFFNQHLLKIATATWLKDPIYSVRRAAVHNLFTLISTFGSDWGLQIIFPQVLRLSQERAHVHRLTALFCVQEFVHVCSVESIINGLLSIPLELAQDTIPNVRLNVAKTLEQILKSPAKHQVFHDIHPVLVSLARDQDRDVKYFAEQALSALDSDV